MGFRKEILGGDQQPSRGLYKPANAGDDEALVVGNIEQIAPSGTKIRESDFYEPFADWLKNDLDEVTDVAPLGGASMKTKWARQMSSACKNHLPETSSSFLWKSCPLKSRSIHKRRWSPSGRPLHIGCFRPKP